jgi:F-box-like
MGKERRNYAADLSPSPASSSSSSSKKSHISKKSRSSKKSKSNNSGSISRSSSSRASSRRGDSVRTAGANTLSFSEGAAEARRGFVREPAPEQLVSSDQPVLLDADVMTGEQSPPGLTLVQSRADTASTSMSMPTGSMVDRAAFAQLSASAPSFESSSRALQPYALAPQLWEKVFSFLPTRIVCHAVMLVCKEWMHLVNHSELLWRSADLSKCWT